MAVDDRCNHISSSGVHSGSSCWMPLLPTQKRLYGKFKLPLEN